MKTKFKTRLLSLALAVVLLFAVLPITALAETASADPNVIDLVEGDAVKGFLPAGTPCMTSDPAIAWVDGDGTLNALKPGTVTLSVYEGEDYTVNVADYTDGSPIVGNLKLLARYNDSMQFYDGHVYLLFTSYQDGVEISVDDLYASYEIQGSYYEDIRENIANGSNHTEGDPGDYFSFNQYPDSEPMVLNRGEIVTIGMYRDFGLSVPQAALGSITNSSYWTKIVKAGKSSVIETIFNFLDSGRITADEAVDKVKAVFDELGLDYTKALDGVVDGGVCFNRELYNQKLEWDQYENVTYETEITQNQLDTLVGTLSGNHNRFSILKNSCATVALRAWNEAVGTADGEPNAYYLESTGTGIFSLIDAPKTVRDSIVDKLPGYYLNNADDVEEPDAGYQDETGWVYVSAPEKVDPVNYVVEESGLVLDTEDMDMTEVVNAAGAGFVYGKEAPTVNVSVNGALNGDNIKIDSVDFSCDGKTVSFDGNAKDEAYIHIKAPYAAPAEGKMYFLYDEEGELVDFCEYYDDENMLSMTFFRLPVNYTIKAEDIPEDQPQLYIYVFGDYEADVETEVYRYVGGEKVILEQTDDVTAGEKIYVRASVGENEEARIVDSITVEGESILDEAHYDAEEDAYFFFVPEDDDMVDLTIEFREPEITKKKTGILQVAVGDVLNLSDIVSYEADGMEKDPDEDMTITVYGDQDILAFEDGAITVTGAGTCGFWVSPKTSKNIGVIFALEAYESLDNMVAITASDEFLANMAIIVTDEEGGFNGFVLSSGYLVEKGTLIRLMSSPSTAVLPYNVTANKTSLKNGDVYTVTDAVEFKADFYEAQVKNMPKTVNLKTKDDTYQLSPKVSYTGLINQLKAVYDDSVKYVSGDPLVSVDENGLITVTGDIPEDGAAVIVTAYAGSSNRKVYAQTKVVVGDYAGDKIAGRLTIWARPIVEGQLVSHGAIAFTTYEDIDLDASYYEYYQPNEQYQALMQDYVANPDNYDSDPAMYNDNELGIENRASYFDIYHNGANADPATVSLKAGESIAMSNYGFDRDNLVTVYKALNGTSAMTNATVAALVQQMEAFGNGEEIDGEAAFDNFFSTLLYMINYTKVVGRNPADGQSEGGFAINREMYNQFRRDDTQLPNNYCTIEITADELSQMKAFLAAPENNYYSLFVKNCATGATDVWNAALYDKPELHLTANYTGLAADPQSLYFEIALKRIKSSIMGYEYGVEFGTDFVPHTIAIPQEVKDVIAAIDAIGEVEFTTECKVRIADARAAFEALNEVQQGLVYNEGKLLDAEIDFRDIEDAAEYDDSILGDADNDTKVTILDATNIQRIIASLTTAVHNRFAADVDGDGMVTILDATWIQRFLASLSCPDHIGEKIINFPDPAEEPAVDVASMTKMGEVFDVNSDGIAAFDGKHLYYLVIINRCPYYIVADIDSEIYEQLDAIEGETREERDSKAIELTKDAPISTCLNLCEHVPEKANELIDSFVQALNEKARKLID